MSASLPRRRLGFCHFPTALGLEHAQRIIGIHLNYIAGRFLFGGTLNQTPDDEMAKSYLAELSAWWDLEGGYSHVQSTKPQTLGYALNDSPVGLAAWIVEKFRSWSDCDGELEQIFTRDELLTNVMTYWVTESMNSSTRLYYETREQPLRLSPANRVEVPVGVAVFPKEIPLPPRAVVERGYNIVRWTVMLQGRPLAAMEQPELLAQDIREFFRPLRWLAGTDVRVTEKESRLRREFLLARGRSARALHPAMHAGASPAPVAMAAWAEVVAAAAYSYRPS